MLPNLISFGPFSISSYGIMLVLAFLFGTFIIWRFSRDAGIDEIKIFDNIIIVGVSVISGARLAFALFHPQIYYINFLRLFLIWKYPGFSFWGAVITGFIILIFISKKQRLIWEIVFDAYGKAIPVAAFFISLGLFLDGSIIGNTTTWFTGLPVAGVSGKRHPVALYATFLIILLWFLSIIVQRKIYDKEKTCGLLGWISLSGLGLIQLILAFFRTDLLYLNGISIDRIFATVLFITPLSPIFVLTESKKMLLFFKETIMLKLVRK